MVDGVQLYKPFKRLFKGPMDVDTIYNSYEDALLHAKSNVAYDGEVIKIIKPDNVYMYTVFNGDLLKIPVEFSAKDIDNAISTAIIQKENGIEVSTKLKISAKDGNILTINDDGLYASVQEVVIPSPQSPPINSEGGSNITVPQNVARKYVINIGDGFSNDIKITHNLNTPRVTLTVWTNETPSEMVICDISILDNNNLIIHFDNVPNKDEYSVMIVG